MNQGNKDYELLSTEELEELLRRDCFGIESLEQDVLFTICDILAKRRPPRRTTQEAFQEFVKYYAPVEWGLAENEEDLP